MAALIDFKQQYGPWAVIAGASEGLGAAFARQVAGHKVNLILVARRADRLADLAAELAGQYSVHVKTLVLDLGSQQAAGQVAAETAGFEVGLLVYNAASSIIGPFEKHSLEEHYQVIDTNIRTPCGLTHSLGGRMLERGRGGIILMSSLSALQGSALVANYAASKAYNQILGEGLWEEWRSRGVDVLACLAGAIGTPNYQASRPKTGGLLTAPVMTPEAVARAALSALGKQPQVIPGGSNRLAAFVMTRLLPRRAVVAMMGRILRGMYGF